MLYTHLLAVPIYLYTGWAINIYTCTVVLGHSRVKESEGDDERLQTTAETIMNRGFDG